MISELFFEGVVNMILLFGLSNTLCLAKVLLNFSGVSQSCFLRDYVHLAVSSCLRVSVFVRLAKGQSQSPNSSTCFEL